MTLAFYPTDYCLWLVFIVLGISLVISLRHQPTRLALQRLLSRPIAVGSGIVLMFFIVIGLLDSVHYQYDKGQDNDEIVSIVDSLLYPVGTQYEKTYSAPMALYLFSTEIVYVDGIVQQRYPALKFPKIFHQGVDRSAWIIKNLLYSLLGAGVIAIFIYAALKYYSKSALSSVQWTALMTAFSCFFVIFASYLLSRHLHVLGTGKIGEDIFYYSIKSIRTALVIGLLTTLFMLPLALFLGIAAGYFGGWIDDVIQYVYTTLSSIPGVLLITASVLSMQTWIANHPEQFASLDKAADARLLALCLILGISSWTSLCRLLRAEVLKLREIDYVTAARALGSSSWVIIMKHLLPNVMHIVVITLVLDFSFLVLAEAVLSYVGVGVSPLTMSWGNMINSARLELAREPMVWWPIMAAFVAMFALVLSSNLFADAVRDAFDPNT